MSKIYVIGGANIDLYAKSVKQIILKDSNIADISFSFGGVGRNIVENLTNLGEDVTFLTCFGNDSFADLLKADLLKRGVDISFSRTYDAHSSIYLALLDKEDMFVGMNDMKIMNNLSKEDIDELGKAVNDDDFVFVDTNLSEEMILYIFDNLKGHKISDAISANKVNKLKKVLGRIDILKLNALEASALSGKDMKSESNVLALLRLLMTLGTKEILITVADSVYLGYQKKVYCFKHNAYRPNPVNVTGAGDALLSAYAFSRFHEASIEASVAVGMAAAVLTVDSIGAVGDISKEKLKDEMNRMKVQGGVIYEYQD